jgi:hypothetical protein
MKPIEARKAFSQGCRKFISGSAPSPIQRPPLNNEMATGKNSGAALHAFPVFAGLQAQYAKLATRQATSP